ncbi:hypothetical protein SAMN03159338_1494 [Sphingomonas sp. NFR04]|uniref:hypothetical protein n=1 Tax=Sphingomonas sp. NFR04 TaxID=1566283 RepID=UPI0008EA6A15|nr:hypothetical protein [Sphingomonas sp. NFR04]SFJ47502.1 hypothetical protein SAMN03159338_1494 [Sphingomonas sp. NFR04]
MTFRTLTEQIDDGLQLAREKGCPVWRIVMRDDARMALANENLLGSLGIVSFRGIQIETTHRSNAREWELTLECGWTDRHGNERSRIGVSDLEELQPEPIDHSSMEAHPLWASF